MATDLNYSEIEALCLQELQQLKIEEVVPFRDFSKNLLKVRLFYQENLITELNSMVNQKTFIEDKIKGLSFLIPKLNVMKNEAEDLVSTVNDISQNSEKISGKIRQLDTARVIRI